MSCWVLVEANAEDSRWQPSRRALQGKGHFSDAVDMFPMQNGDLTGLKNIFNVLKFSSLSNKQCDFRQKLKTTLVELHCTLVGAWKRALSVVVDFQFDDRGGKF